MSVVLRGRWWMVSVLMMLVAGCHDSVSTTPSHEPHVSRGDTGDVRSIAHDVQNAPDALTEANALRKLHDHSAEQRYTYNVEAYDVATGTKVTSPSTYALPVRVHVSVFRGDQPVHDFTFVPRDNRNVGLIAKG